MKLQGKIALKILGAILILSFGNTDALFSGPRDPDPLRDGSAKALWSQTELKAQQGRENREILNSYRAGVFLATMPSLFVSAAMNFQHYPSLLWISYGSATLVHLYLDKKKWYPLGAASYLRHLKISKPGRLPSPTLAGITASFMAPTLVSSCAVLIKTLVQ